MFEALNLMVIGHGASLYFSGCVAYLNLDVHVAVSELWRSSEEKIGWCICKPRRRKITEHLAAMDSLSQVELGLVDGLIFQ